MTVRWTESQRAEHAHRRELMSDGDHVQGARTDAPSSQRPMDGASACHDGPIPATRSTGVSSLSKPKATIRDDGMNRLEAAWADELKEQVRRGDIQFWKFSPGGLRLADKTFYHPDFLVVEADGTVRYDETKGFMRDDANMKLKVAAAQFPFVFRLIQKQGKSWKITTI